MKHHPVLKGTNPTNSPMLSPKLTSKPPVIDKNSPYLSQQARTLQNSMLGKPQAMSRVPSFISRFDESNSKNRGEKLMMSPPNNSHDISSLVKARNEGELLI